MRLFLAIRLPAAATGHLDEALQAARPSTPAAVHWIARERWHLTLAFYGEVADDRVDRLRADVGRRLAGTPGLDLDLHGFGRFGDRVLWVGVGGPDVDRLTDLGAAVSVDDRRYRPHLTVARTRGRADLRAVVAGLGDYEGPRWSATAVTLIRSRLGPHPTYDDIASWPLPASS